MRGGALINIYYRYFGNRGVSFGEGAEYTQLNEAGERPRAAAAGDLRAPFTSCFIRVKLGLALRCVYLCEYFPWLGYCRVRPTWRLRAAGASDLGVVGVASCGSRRGCWDGRGGLAARAGSR